MRAPFRAIRAKYRNKIAMRGKIKFHSQSEARRYDQLCLLEKFGDIRDLKLQVPFKLEVNGVPVCKYIADFVYDERQRDGTWLERVEDVKGFPTPEYKLKRALMKAVHGINIRETK